MPEPLSLYDRPAVAVANLARGRFKQAAQALVSPNELSPEDRKSMVDRWGLTGATRTIAEIATNPLVIMGLILHMRYPVLGAKALAKFKAGVADYANRAGVILRNVGTLQTNFKNTKIPRIVDELTFTMGKMQDKYAPMVGSAVEKYEQTVGKVIDAPTMTRIQMWLKGMYKPGNQFQAAWKLSRPLWTGRLSEPEQALANTLRGTYNQIWDEVLGSETAQQAALKVLRRRGDSGSVPKTIEILVRRLNEVGLKVPESRTSIEVANHLADLGVMDKATAARLTDQKKLYKLLAQNGFERVGGRDLAEIVKYRDYAPELVRMAPEDFDDMMKEMIMSARGREQVHEWMTSAAPGRVVSPAARTKRWRLIPDPTELSAIADELDPTALRELEERVARSIKAHGGAGELSEGGLGGVLENLGRMTSGVSPEKVVRRYSTLSIPVFQRYMQSMAKHYAWTTRRLGPLLMKHVDRLKDPLGVHMMMDTYIPQLLGRGSFRQSIQSMQWADQRDKMLRSLVDPKGWVSKLVPQDTRKWLYDQILSTRSAISLQGANQGITDYFYMSTLSFNVSSAIKNLFQTTLTTIPMIGGRATVAGVKKTMANTSRYFDLRRAGLGKDLAFERAFKDFVQAGLEPSPSTERMLRRGVEEAWDGANRGILGSGTAKGVKSAWNKAKEMGLGMFQTTEIFNRLTAFYGGQSLALSEGLGAKAAMNLGREVTRATQFPVGGPLGPGQSPYMLRNVPAAFKQFLHFPLRYVEFLGSSLHRGGGPGLNWGTIGRGLAWSGATYTAGKELLGMDLSNALLFGALPAPMGPDTPFYPFPIVPPALSVLGSGAHAALTGTTEQLSRTAPLLVPFGISAARLRRNLSPEFADYKNRDPDGRIPLYSRAGSRIGAFTGLELYARSLWSSDINAATERELMQYLVSQRDKIRGYRREYLEAVARNDMPEASKVQGQFQSDYPDLGPMKIKRSDVEAIHLRKRITRLERLLDTMPPEYRPVFGQMIAEAMGGYTQSLLGIDPSLLSAPGTTARSRRRAAPPQAPSLRGWGGQGSGNQWTQPFGPARNRMPLGTSQTSMTFGAMTF